MISSEGCFRCPILAIDRYEQLASDPIAATPSYERNRLFRFWQRLGNGPRGDMTSKENFTPDGGGHSLARKLPAYGRVEFPSGCSPPRAQGTVSGTSSQMQVVRQATTLGFAHFILKRS